MTSRSAGFVKLDLTGDGVLAARFRALPWMIQDRILPLSLKSGGEIVRRRARALAPRRSGRLAGGTWGLRQVTRKRGGRPVFVGVRVAAPRRGALGIPGKATGYYPFSLEFGWRVGARVQGPVDLGARVVRRNRRGRLYRTNERTSHEARLMMNAHRRKIPGRRYMYAALFGAAGAVVLAIRTDLSRRISQLSPGSIAVAGSRSAA